VVHSVSKSLGPDLRLAIVTGDDETVERVQGRQRLGTGWVSHELQTMVAAAYGDDRVRRRLAAAAEAYAERRRALVDALGGHGVAATAASGLNVWVPVPDEAATCTALLTAGFAVQSGARFRHHSPTAVRITVSRLTAAATPAVARTVAASVRSAGRFTS